MYCYGEMYNNIEILTSCTLYYYIYFLLLPRGRYIMVYENRPIGLRKRTREPRAYVVHMYIIVQR